MAIGDAADKARFRSMFDRLAGELELTINIRPDAGSHGLPFRCAEHVVVEHGDLQMTFLDDCRFPHMKPGNCFANAFTLALRDARLKYYEGWAIMEQGLATHHAWIVHEDGKVSDPTWASVMAGYLADPSVKLMDGFANRALYFGIHVPMEMHLGWFMKKGTMNLLSCNEMTEIELLMHGIEAFGPYRVAPERMPSTYQAVFEAMEKDAKRNEWTLDPATSIFTNGEGRRWCGITKRFL